MNTLQCCAPCRDVSLFPAPLMKGSAGRLGLLWSPTNFPGCCPIRAGCQAAAGHTADVDHGQDVLGRSVSAKTARQRESRSHVLFCAGHASTAGCMCESNFRADHRFKSLEQKYKSSHCGMNNINVILTCQKRRT